MNVEKGKITGVVESYKKHNLRVFKTEYGVFVLTPNGVIDQRICPYHTKTLNEVEEYTEKTFDCYFSDERLFFIIEEVDSYSTLNRCSVVVDEELAIYIGGLFETKPDICGQSNDKQRLYKVYTNQFTYQNNPNIRGEYVREETIEEMVSDNTVEVVSVV